MARTTSQTPSGSKPKLKSGANFTGAVGRIAGDVVGHNKVTIIKLKASNNELNAEYKREKTFYIELSTLIDNIIDQISSGDFHINDNVMPASQEKIIKMTAELREELEKTFAIIRPMTLFIPQEIFKLIGNFWHLAAEKATSWEYPALYQPPIFTAALDKDQFTIKAQELQKMVRLRLAVLQKQMSTDTSRIIRQALGS